MFKKSDNVELFTFVYRACQVIDILFALRDFEYQGYLSLFFCSDDQSGLFDQWRGEFAKKIDFNEPLISDELVEQPKASRLLLRKRTATLVQGLNELKMIADFFPKLNVHSVKNQQLMLKGEVDYLSLDELLKREIFFI